MIHSEARRLHFRDARMILNSQNRAYVLTIDACADLSIISSAVRCQAFSKVRKASEIAVDLCNRNCENGFNLKHPPPFGTSRPED